MTKAHNSKSVTGIIPVPQIGAIHPVLCLVKLEAWADVQMEAKSAELGSETSKDI